MSEPSIKIECPACEWQPDGEIYWLCSCSHRWDTFQTKGKCPSCGIQWKDTRCPGCGKMSPHEQWYKDLSKPLADDPADIKELKRKKRKLESRLIAMGIRNYRVSHLPYLDHSNEEFQTPYDTGCRLLILVSISYAAVNPDSRPQITQWLQDQHLWEKVSPKEQEFFNGQQPDQKKLVDLSWSIEGAIVLGWALGLVDKLYDIDTEETDEDMDSFLSHIPAIGDETSLFLSRLQYRDLEEVYEENLLNELVTTYFRDLFLKGQQDKTQINGTVSFERHRALNWMRKFAGIEDWDDTVTST